MKKNFLRILSGFGVLGLSLGLSSCLDSGSEDPQAQLLRDVETIDSYLTSQGLTAVEDINGIRMVITELGMGLPAFLTSKVDVDYVGKLFTTNAIFDQGNTKGIVSNYIDGWKIALTTLPAGSKATLYIPPYWGYGNSAQPSIPASSILVFDIEFNDVVETSQELQKLASDTVAIDNYLEEKVIDAIKDSTGLRYVITELGIGSIPTWYDKVKFKSSFKLLTDDTKVVAQFDFEPTSDSYNRVIDQLPNGLKIGLQKLPVGSKATFYLPSGLGYGPQGAGNGAELIIPANANIIVNIELTEIVTP